MWGLRKGLRDHKKFMSLKYANRATIHPITTLPRNALVLLYKPRVEKPIIFLTMTKYKYGIFVGKTLYISAFLDGYVYC